MKRDNLHFTFREIDGYNLPFNFVISEREAGKSTAAWLEKCYNAFLHGFTSLIIKRNVVDITEVFMEDIETIINKFVDEPIKIKYKSNALKEGIVNVYIEDKLFIRVCALSLKLSRLKSLILRNLKYMLFDEFICNTRMGESYLKAEAFKFKEIFNTFQRENPSVKCYFLGNPYSLYNPYFVEFGIPTNKLKRGTIFAHNNCVVQCYEIKEELRKLIKERNPLYKFDDAYTKYAFNGLNVNDSNIKIGELPPNYKLQYIFRIEGKYIAIFKNNYVDDMKELYFCKFIDNPYSRQVFCFDFAELVEKTALLSSSDRIKFSHFKCAIQRRDVVFESIECYYLVEEIYFNL